jgi:hypothetical protein
MNLPGSVFGLLLALGATGCVIGPHAGLPAAAVDRAEPGAVLRALDLDPALEDRILALDPGRITEQDLRTTLAAAPAPRVIGVHGGVYPVHLAMESFARFLIAMGYPEQRLRHPGDGRLSHSPYEDSVRLTGLVAWYYEKEGLRPMLVGHSLGGVQAVKVLYGLAGRFDPQIPVWNPLTDRAENRFTIIDPLTGEERPVVGLRLPYVSVVGAGGAAVLFPNQWSMLGKVRSVPDTVEEFTAYAIDLDLFAWDLPGLSSASAFQASGAAKVRNVRLPAGYSHVVVPVTAHLAKDPAMKDRINAYAPGQTDGFPTTDGAADNALWAADVWYSIKRHWCLEAQRLIRAKRAALRGGTIRATEEKQGREDARVIEQ